MTEKSLLVCGIIAPVVYLGTDFLAGKLIKGYDFSAQSMSDLPAIGSPTRGLALILTLIAGILMAAFAVGVWNTANGAILPHIVAVLLLGNVVLGLAAHLFFANQFGVQPAFGTPGVMLMFFSVLCFVLAMGFGAFAFNGWIRVLSIVIPAAYILLAFLRIVTASSSHTGSAAPLMGIQERTMVYSFLAWVAALSVYLLQE